MIVTGRLGTATCTFRVVLAFFVLAFCAKALPHSTFESSPEFPSFRHVLPPPPSPAPIVIHYHNCSEQQSAELTSEFQHLRAMAMEVLSLWHDHGARGRQLFDKDKLRRDGLLAAYDFFFSGRDSAPLFTSESQEVKGTLMEVVGRLARLKPVHPTDGKRARELQSDSGGMVENGELRVMCTPRKELDCGGPGTALGEDIEAFVSNGPTILLGDGKRLLTNTNDVYLCPHFWRNKSLHGKPLPALREISVGDFGDYRLFTLAHELLHTPTLTSPVYISPIMSDQHPRRSESRYLTLGFQDHAYGLRYPRSSEAIRPPQMPDVYGERMVRTYNEEGRLVGWKTENVPYVTSLSRDMAWVNADTVVYWLWVGWSGLETGCLTDARPEVRARSRRGPISRRQRIQEILIRNRRPAQQAVLGGKEASTSARLGLKEAECNSRCVPGSHFATETLGTPGERKILKRSWCQPEGFHRRWTPSRSVKAKSSSHNSFPEKRYVQK
ncbi:hypothetical protein BDZ91DRAFT_733918 [Kalaharituber pfeilii]|nr:hypothetical protein BDZ91DRAFT_733918 [Kalaharituber pfeilii]